MLRTPTCEERRGEVAVFLHVFSKGRKANLSKSELAIYLKAAQELEKLSEEGHLAAGTTRGWRRLEI